MGQKKEQFGIRKLSVGVCSALIGVGLVATSPVQAEGVAEEERLAAI